MRHIYLIRHGEPEFPDGVRCCIGRTDLCLSQEGRRQAKRLGGYFAKIPLTAVYCSTLTRAVQTAYEIIRDGVPLSQVEALQELYSGLWEGLTFDEIREKYPQQYAKRGIDPEHFTPNQGGSFEEGICRFQAAVKQIVDESTGNIVIVAHATVNRLLLCSLMQKSFNKVYSVSQPYGCISEITEENGTIKVGRVGFLPSAFACAVSN